MKKPVEEEISSSIAPTIIDRRLELSWTHYQAGNQSLTTNPLLAKRVESGDRFDPFHFTAMDLFTQELSELVREAGCPMSDVCAPSSFSKMRVRSERMNMNDRDRSYVAPQSPSSKEEELIELLQAGTEAIRKHRTPGRAFTEYVRSREAIAAQELDRAYKLRMEKPSDPDAELRWRFQRHVLFVISHLLDEMMHYT